MQRPIPCSTDTLARDLSGPSFWAIHRSVNPEYTFTLFPDGSNNNLIKIDISVKPVCYYINGGDTIKRIYGLYTIVRLDYDEEKLKPGVYFTDDYNIKVWNKKWNKKPQKELVKIYRKKALEKINQFESKRRNRTKLTTMRIRALENRAGIHQQDEDFEESLTTIPEEETEEDEDFKENLTTIPETESSQEEIFTFSKENDITKSLIIQTNNNFIIYTITR